MNRYNFYSKVLANLESLQININALRETVKHEIENEGGEKLG